MADVLGTGKKPRSDAGFFLAALFGVMSGLGAQSDTTLQDDLSIMRQ